MKNPDGSTSSKKRRKDEVRSPKPSSFKRLQTVSSRNVWDDNLDYVGPKALKLFKSKGSEAFNSSDEISKDDFLYQAKEMTALYKAQLDCRQPSDGFFLGYQTRSNFKKTLVLDIDETLVHSDLQPEKSKLYDFVFRVQYNDKAQFVYLNKRPFVDEFLDWCSQNFEVVTFTSAIESYSDKVTDYLDKDGTRIKHKFHREHCTYCLNREVFFKDLSRLNRHLKDVILVDNSPYSFWYQIENGIPIESFYTGMEDDTELKKLKAFLEKIKDEYDVRPIIRERFQMTELLEALNNAEVSGCSSQDA